LKSYVVREDTRDAILDATDRLLARYGYKKMTIDDLAAEVGMGKGSIYLHFSSKEEIALARIDRIVERLKERLVEIAAADIPVEERVKQALLTRVLFRFDSVQHYTQSLDDLLARLRPGLLARRRQYFEDEAKIIAKVLEEGQKSGAFSAGDPVGKAHLLLLATNSLLPYSLSTVELGERKDIEEKTRQLADLLVQGLSMH
jgi:TetR/AcrR family fatty acid metabolism transcriptional regulator